MTGTPTGMGDRSECTFPPWGPRLVLAMLWGLLIPSCRWSDKPSGDGDSGSGVDTGSASAACDPADGVGEVEISVNVDPSDPFAATAREELGEGVFLSVGWVEEPPHFCFQNVDPAFVLSAMVGPEWADTVDVSAGYICALATGGFTDPDDHSYRIQCGDRPEPVHVSPCEHETLDVVLQCSRTLIEDDP